MEHSKLQSFAYQHITTTEFHPVKEADEYVKKEWYTSKFLWFKKTVPTKFYRVSSFDWRLIEINELPDYIFEEYNWKLYEKAIVKFWTSDSSDSIRKYFKSDSEAKALYYKILHNMWKTISFNW